MALTDKLVCIANAIRSKTGGTDAMSLDQMVTEIEGISAGGSTPEEEWIGDGNTHIWVTLPEGRTSPMMGVCPNGTVTVDWGDGTEPDTLTGTSTSTVEWTPKHDYVKSGNYVITLIVDGEIRFSGSNSNNNHSYLMRFNSGGDSRNRAYQNTVQKIEIGNSVTSIGDNAFVRCSSLASVVIPDSVTSIGSSAFQYCSSLASVVIPDSVTSISSSAFAYCSSLASVVIPDSVTSISSSAFYECYSLASVVIPDSVTSIGDNAFYKCLGIRYYDFTKHTAVPEISHTNAFNNIPADCEIHVPAALYDEWIAATNWTIYASKIVAV